MYINQILLQKKFFLALFNSNALNFSAESTLINTILYCISCPPKYCFICSRLLNPTATSKSSKLVIYEAVGFMAGTTYFVFCSIVESIINTLFS